MGDQAVAVVEMRSGCDGQCPGWTQLGFPWHESIISDVAFSADGKTIATVSPDGTLRTWSGDDLAPHHVFAVDTSDDALLALADDGRRLGYASGKSLQWFDLSRGRRDGAAEALPAEAVALRPVPGSDGFVLALEDGTVRGPNDFSLALGRRVLAAAVDAQATRVAISHNAEAGPHMEFGAVGVFDLVSGERLLDVKTHRAGEDPDPSAYLMPAHHLAFSPDGTRLAGGGYGLQIWSSETGLLELDPGWQGNTFESKVTELAFAPDGQSVTFIADLAVPVAMAVDAEQPTRRFADDVLGRALAESRSRIVVGSGDGTLRLFERGTAQPLAVVEGPSAGVVALGFSAHADELFAGLSDGTLLVLPLDGSPMRSVPAHTDELNGLLVVPEAGLLVTGAHDGSLRAWDSDTLAAVATIGERGAPVFALTRCGELGGVLAARADGTVDRIELDPPAVTQSFAAHDKEVTGVACTEDGTRIVTVSEDGTGKLWSAQGKPLATLLASEGKRAYQAVVFVAGPEASRPAIVSGEAFLGGDALRRWTIPTHGEPRATAIAKLKFGVTRLVPMPGADAVVGANLETGGATIWDATDGTIVASFPGVRGTTMAVAVSADGNAIASGTTGNERAIRVWRR